MNFVRVKGLLSALGPFYDEGDTTQMRPWWLDSSERPEVAHRLKAFSESVESIYTQKTLYEIKRRALHGDKHPVSEFLRKLPDTIARYRLHTPLPTKELRLAAELHVKAEFRTGNLNCLGIGEEGVVLTDGRMVIQVLPLLAAQSQRRPPRLPAVACWQAGRLQYVARHQGSTTERRVPCCQISVRARPTDTLEGAPR